jgi:hypothetical protein
MPSTWFLDYCWRILDKNLKYRYRGSLHCEPCIAAAAPCMSINAGQPMFWDSGTFAYSFTDADAPTRHKTQYFEMLGYQGIYSDGWMASATPCRVPWVLDLKAFAEFDPSKDLWELYDIDGGDFSQAKNLADQNPEKLDELKKLFDQEARKNHVYPVGGSLGRLLQPESDPQMVAAKNRWVMNANVYRIPELAGPNLKSRDWVAKAQLQVDKDTQGVIFAEGYIMGGLSLYIKDHRLKFNYSTLGLYIAEAVSDIQVPHGEVQVEVRHTMLERKARGSALVELFINVKKVGETTLEATVPMAFSAYEPFDIGRDSGGAVSQGYRDKGEFKFTGVIEHVVFDLK